MTRQTVRCATCTLGDFNLTKGPCNQSKPHSICPHWRHRFIFHNHTHAQARKPQLMYSTPASKQISSRPTLGGQGLFLIIVEFIETCEIVLSRCYNLANASSLMPLILSFFYPPKIIPGSCIRHVRATYLNGHDFADTHRQIGFTQNLSCSRARSRRFTVTIRFSSIRLDTR